MPDITARTIVDNEPIRLTGWHDEINDSVLALMFGQLVKRAMPIVEYYHSDLYRDGQWIDKHIHGVARFFFTARQCGTQIGFDRRLVVEFFNGYSEPHQSWMVDLTRREGVWFVQFTTIETI